MSKQNPANLRDWTACSVVTVALGVVVVGLSLGPADPTTTSDSGSPLGLLVGIVLTGSGSFALLVPVIAKGVLLGNQLFADSEDRRSRERQE